MSSINELFIATVNEGLKSIKGVSDPSQKAMAYAELAKALALTGKVGSTADLNELSDEVKTGKEALKEAPKAVAKETPKETPKEAKKLAPAKKKEEPQEAAEPELTAEWTEEMVGLKSVQIDKMNDWKEEYDEDSLNQAVKMFSEGQLESLDDISPLNIDAFLEFLEALSNQAE